MEQTAPMHYACRAYQAELQQRAKTWSEYSLFHGTRTLTLCAIPIARNIDVVVVGLCIRVSVWRVCVSFASK